MIFAKSNLISNIAQLKIFTICFWFFSISKKIFKIRVLMAFSLRGYLGLLVREEKERLGSDVKTSGCNYRIFFKLKPE